MTEGAVAVPADRYDAGEEEIKRRLRATCAGNWEK